MIVVLFHRQRDNLTEHLQIKFHHSSLILTGGIECVTIAPGPLHKRQTNWDTVQNLQMVKLEGVNIKFELHAVFYAYMPLQTHTNRLLPLFNWKISLSK